MNLYVASRLENKLRIRQLVPILREHGFGVVSSWHREHHAPDTQIGDISPAYLRSRAVSDIQELKQADACLVYSKGCETSRGGMWFEMGFCFAEEKPIFVIGPKVTIFNFLPGVRTYESVEEFLEKEQQ